MINTERKWEDSKESIPHLDKMISESTHPEMQDIDPNEEFIVVKFDTGKDLTNP